MSNIDNMFERLTNIQRRVLLALAKHTVDFIIIGGLVEIYYGIKPRSDDLDILIPPRPENAEGVATAMLEVVHDAIDADEVRRRLSKLLQRVHYNDVDFLTLVNEFEYLELRDRSVIEAWEGISVRIVAKADLLKLKERKSGDAPGR